MINTSCTVCSFCRLQIIKNKSIETKGITVLTASSSRHNHVGFSHGERTELKLKTSFTLPLPLTPPPKKKRRQLRCTDWKLLLYVPVCTRAVYFYTMHNFAWFTYFFFCIIIVLINECVYCVVGLLQPPWGSQPFSHSHHQKSIRCHHWSQVDFHDVRQ